jgi:hypothetical protein
MTGYVKAVDDVSFILQEGPLGGGAAVVSQQ